MLPSIYRIESISSITEMWGMFSKKMTELEYEFPSFLPEESRVTLVYTSKGVLSRVKYAPMKYDFQVILKNDKEYQANLINQRDIECKNVLDVNNANIMEKIQEFFVNTITP